ncbi:MAG: bifunctional heptose 7-phosphate kinase/heptose 1-phosphate adenyltransferase [Kiritimatiellia bacterium]
MSLSVNRARKLISSFSGQRILVVGDLMLDRFIYGSVSRISPEAPVPVVRVKSESNMPGGASNVAWNIQSLGGRSAVGGFAGDDQAAAELRSVLARGKVGVDCVQTVPGSCTTVKTRIIAEHQQVCRVDWDAEPDYKNADFDLFTKTLRKEVGRATGVIIEDYGKGVVRQAVVDAVISAAKMKGIPVGFDPKDNCDLKVSGVTVAMPNHREAFWGAGMKETPVKSDPLKDVSLLKAGERLLKIWEPGFVVITLGSLGMLMMAENAKPVHIPTRAREVYDVSGAGDTVVAATVLALAAGATHREAAELANFAAGVVVGKLGTATCTASELLKSVREGL